MLVWYLLRQKGVPEAYTNIIRDIYPGCKTSVMNSAGETKEIEVGLYQGSVLSPPLFVVIIDVIREHIEEGTPWAMLLADDLVLCDPDREMMELRQERWKESMEKKHLQTTGDVDRLGWIREDRNGQLANSAVLHISLSGINDRQNKRSQQSRGGMVEMERSEWFDLR